ncbi:MAG: response regulator [Candidatus Muiribacteriota bacterium]
MKDILVVDDEKSVLMLIESFLQENNFNTAVAMNGIDAIKILEKRSFDIIILDLSMPALDGFEVCQHIRNVLMLDTKIIVITAFENSSRLDELIKFNVSKIFIKPFKVEELINYINSEE